MKFSIVTPVYNGERFIAETIESVLSQEGLFHIEYVIADGASTDRTLSIVQSYAERVAAGTYPLRCTSATLRYFSQKDEGMYDAIEKGFRDTPGEVMAYINADDQYLQGAFAAVAAIFSTYPDIAWVKGINQTSDERGTITNQGSCFLYRQDWLQKGLYGRVAPFIQQDSVFWRRELWDDSNPSISQYRLAGDYALWVAFSKKAPLWSCNIPVSIFRRRPGQLSADMRPYRREQERIVPHNFFLEKRVALFFSLVRVLRLPLSSILSQILYRSLFPFSNSFHYVHFSTDGIPRKESTIGPAV